MIFINADGVDFSGFTVQNSSSWSSGMEIDSVQNCNINNNIFQNNNNGLSLEFSEAVLLPIIFLWKLETEFPMLRKDLLLPTISMVYLLEPIYQTYVVVKVSSRRWLLFFWYHLSQNLYLLSAQLIEVFNIFNPTFNPWISAHFLWINNRDFFPINNN